LYWRSLTREFCLGALIRSYVNILCVKIKMELMIYVVRL